MSSDRETTRLVRSWLEEGVTALPDRVLDAVLDRLPATPQRRSWWPPRRSALMNSYAKLAMAAAAVVIAAVVGYNLLPSFGGPGTRATPTPVVTPPTSPTTEPSTPPLGEGSLAPGRYAWYWSGPTISFAVPTGWTGRTTDMVKHGDSPTEVSWGRPGQGVIPDFNVYADACRSEGTLKPFERTVDGLVAALDAQAGTDATIADATVADRPAKRIDLVQSAGLDRATCRDGSDGPLRIWVDSEASGWYFSLAPGMSGFAHALDLDGDLIVFAASIAVDASAADIAEVEAIVASIQIGP